MERQKNKSIVIIVICILLHFSLFVLQQIVSVPNEKLAAIYTMLFIGIIYYVIFLAILFWFEKGISLAFIFVSASACFVLGHHIVLLFNPTQQVYLLMDYGISMQSYFKTMFYILTCIDWLVLAYCAFMSTRIIFAFGQKNKKAIVQNTDETENIFKFDDSLRVIGFVIFIASLPFTVYYLLKNIELTNLLGYQGRMGMEQSARNFVAIIAGFFPVSIYMILLSDLHNKLNRYLCLFCLTIYSILYLLAGSRLNIIKIIVVLFVIIYYSEKKLDFRRVLKLLLMGYFAIVVLTLITYFRSENESGGNIVTFLLNNDPLLKFLEETGGTFTTIANVVNNCPNLIEPVYGKSYLNQFFVIIPNIFFDRNPFQVLLNETFNPLYHYGGLSSSMFAEAYYNMLSYGYIYMIVIGCVLSKVAKTISKPRNVVTFLIATYVYSELIWAIRFDTYLILRSVLYYLVIPYYFGRQLLRKH